MRINLLTATVLALTGLSLTGCSTTQTECAAGYSPSFHLTVDSGSEPELSVRSCDSEQCSPIPKPGAIPDNLTDKANEHASFLQHSSRGEWNIGPRGTKDEAPHSATISLYRDGALLTTRHVPLTWPHFDPCAASNPPAPHVTIHVP